MRWGGDGVLPQSYYSGEIRPLAFTYVHIVLTSTAAGMYYLSILGDLERIMATSTYPMKDKDNASERENLEGIARQVAEGYTYIVQESQSSDKQYRRDLIKAALTGLLASKIDVSQGVAETVRKWIAEDAILMADAVLEADK